MQFATKTSRIPSFEATNLKDFLENEVQEDLQLGNPPSISDGFLSSAPAFKKTFIHPRLPKGRLN